MRNLSTLSILHYVYGGFLAFTGLILGVVFYALGGFMDSDLVRNGAEAPPEAVGMFLRGIGGGVGVVLLLWGVVVVLSGRWIAERRNRTGSMIVAGLCCLSFPFGTALGIFTFVTLANDEVKQAYGVL